MNLATFGCSYTYGSYLPDCNDEIHGVLPSSVAWPSLLVKNLNFKTLSNQGFPGSSNYKIMKSILNYKFQKDTFVCVLWTHFERYTIYHNNTDSVNINAWDSRNAKRNKQFYKLIPPHHLDCINSECIDHTFYYLNYHNIPFHFSFAERRNKLTFTEHTKIPYKTVTSKYIFRDLTIDYASDKLHPGIKTHKEFVKKIEKEILLKLS
jgi:hypothetical protein